MMWPTCIPLQATLDGIAPRQSTMEDWVMEAEKLNDIFQLRERPGK